VRPDNSIRVGADGRRRDSLSTGRYVIFHCHRGLAALLPRAVAELPSVARRGRRSAGSGYAGGKLIAPRGVARMAPYWRRWRAAANCGASSVAIARVLAPRMAPRCRLSASAPLSYLYAACIFPCLFTCRTFIIKQTRATFRLLSNQAYYATAAHARHALLLKRADMADPAAFVSYLPLLCYTPLLPLPTCASRWASSTRC